MITRQLFGVAGLLALLTGIPAALLAAYRFPDPDKARPYLHWQAWADALTQPVSDSAITGALVIALWIVWARFTMAVLVQLPAALAGSQAPRIRLLGPEQALAAFLFAAIGLTPAVTATTGTPTLPTATADSSSSVVTDAPLHHGMTHAATATTSGVAHPTTPPAAAAVSWEDAGPPRFAAAGYDGPLTVHIAGRDRTVTVAKNDTLWDLAERYLNDPRRWPEIYQLNRDHYDDNGRMHGGNHIEAGWRLHLPNDAANGRTAPHTPNGDPAENQKPAHPAPSGQPPSTPPTTTPPSTSATPAPSTPAAPAPAASAPHSGDDGVAEPTTTSTPSRPAGAASARDEGATSPAASTPRPGSRAPAGIDLPTGGWVDLGLAAAILTAAALIWTYRRRRYTHRPATPRLRLREGDTTALPATVTHLRRGLRRRTGTDHDHAEHQPGAATDHRPVVRLTTSGHPAGEGSSTPITDPTPVHIGRSNEDEEQDDGKDEEYPSEHDEDEDDDVYGGTIDDQLLGAGLDTSTVAASDAGPVSPALAHPVARLWPPAGLGLTGPGAEAAARGFLTAALATGGIDDPHSRGRVVMSSAICATLLGADAVSLPTSPRLTITGGLSEALSLLEEHTLHRTRLVFDGEVGTVAALRDLDPFTDPLPPIVLIADASALHERARVAALLTQGQRLDIHGILLGAWPDGDTVDVADDGNTTAPPGDTIRHGSHPADLGRLSVLTPAQTTHLLQVLTEAHTGEPPPPAPTETHTLDRAAGLDDANTDTAPASERADVGTGHSGEPETGHNEKKTELSPIEVPESTTPPPVPASVADTAPQHDSASATTEHIEQPGRVIVTLFGAPNLADRPVKPVFRLKAMELLAYLAVQDAPVHRDIVLEDVLGDTQRDKAPMHLNTFVFNVRQVCKVTGGSGTYVHREKDYFSLDGTAFDLDVWRLRDALAHAQTADGPAERIPALRRAVDAYTGEFAEGCDYDWAEPYRQALRNQALDAALDLAHALTTTGDHDQAADVLQTAIRLHPYAEQLYQQAMHAHAARGDLTAVRALRRTLTQHLAEIDAQPSDETMALADRLVASVQAQTPLRRTPRPAEEP
ncbi:BTAD domain-containing putative transcriptional regulator [Paractinoplanes toevensis]|nr:BTAD domain-containing putative transcriptional regulator [Actinoplanes toevensis]